MVRQTWSLGAGWTFHTSPLQNDEYEIVFCDSGMKRNRTSVSGDLATLERAGNGVLVTNRTTRGVDDPCALLDVLQELVIYETNCAFV